MAKATVRVVNPRKTPAMSKPKKRRSSGKRRRNPNPAPMAGRRTRRRRNPARSGRGGGGGLNLRQAFQDALPKLAGKVLVAMAVTRLGDAPTAGSTGSMSPTMGGRWSLTNHIIAGLTAYLGGMLASRMVSGRVGQLVLEGGVDLMASKALWLELIQRVPSGPAWLGQVRQVPQAMMGADWSAIMQQAQPGDIIDDGSGNRYLVGADGRATAMMGTSALVTASPLDGYGYMGADLITAGPMDGYAQRLLQEGAMGHLAVPPDGLVDNAAYISRGSADPYVAALT